jgi:ribonucleoside-diphosphate reductase alpha chain
MDAFGTAVSISLQYGVPLEALVNKFSHMRFEPMGHTTNPEIRVAKSLIDYMFRWLGITFLPGYREQIGLAPPAMSGKTAARSSGSESSGSENAGSATASSVKAGAGTGPGPGPGPGPGKSSGDKSSREKGGTNGASLPKSATGESTGGLSDSPVNGNGATIALTTAAPNGHAASSGWLDSSVSERTVSAWHDDENGALGNRNEQFAKFQSDAPGCDHCGAITVRNGNCYLCHNCGNSMGCS